MKRNYLALACLLFVAAAPATKPAATKRVVFVVDGSETMRVQADAVCGQVELAISELRADQQFNIVFSGEKSPVPFQPRLSPVPPKPGAVKAFTDAALFSGSPKLSKAIDAAVAMRPDLIWLTTNGALAKDDDVATSAAKAKRAGVRINTVLTFTDDKDWATHAHLYRVANATGGVCIGKDGKPLTAEPKDPAPPAPVKPPPKSVFREP